MKLKELHESTMDAKVEDALMRIRKSSTVSPKQIAAAAVAIGWKVEQRLVTTQEPYLNNSDQLFNILGDGVGYGDFHISYIGEHNSKDPIIAGINDKEVLTYEVYSKAEDLIQTAHNAFKKFVVDKVPNEPKKTDKLYVVDLTDPVKHENKSYAPYAFTCQIWFPSKAIILSNKDGESGSMITPLKSTGYDSYRFQGSELYKKFKADVVEFLGLGTVEQEREKKYKAVKLQRLGENSGHCAICAHLQKLHKVGDKFVMVHHGFQRPGHGYIVGDCFGVKYEPYEKSAEACKDYIPHLEGAKKHFEGIVAKLKSGTIDSFTIPKRHKNEQDKILVKGEEAFEKELKSRIHSAEQQIKYIIEDIEMFKKKIADWKEQPLPYLNK